MAKPITQATIDALLAPAMRTLSVAEFRQVDPDFVEVQIEIPACAAGCTCIACETLTGDWTPMPDEAIVSPAIVARRADLDTLATRQAADVARMRDARASLADTLDATRAHLDAKREAIAKREIREHVETWPDLARQSLRARRKPSLIQRLAAALKGGR